MKEVLHAFLEINSILPFHHKEKFIEIKELVEDFNEQMSTNYDPINSTLEYLNHAAKFQS